MNYKSLSLLLTLVGSPIAFVEASVPKKPSFSFESIKKAFLEADEEKSLPDFEDKILLAIFIISTEPLLDHAGAKMNPAQRSEVKRAITSIFRQNIIAYPPYFIEKLKKYPLYIFIISSLCRMVGALEEHAFVLRMTSLVSILVCIVQVCCFVYRAYYRFRETWRRFAHEMMRMQKAAMRAQQSGQGSTPSPF